MNRFTQFALRFRPNLNLTGIYTREYRIAVSSAKIGTLIERDGGHYIITAKERCGTGRGSSTTKVTLKNAKTSQQSIVRLKDGETAEVVGLTKREYQYLYSDNNAAYLMNMETLEELQMPFDCFEGGNSNLPLLQDGIKVVVMAVEPNFKPILWKLLKHQEYTVDSVQGFKDASKSSLSRTVIINGSFSIKVPDFIKLGDKIIVDTESHQFVSRV
ncbi:hypothetical protein BB561_005937 [Smittium simulii]|uniref:Translation elongation factor P/YeiP central domain-containing protein n=1 Tax=Smittium simulii TaxID=133385 RepID=A0A2T9Y7J7_9FUNG|nr:hypothetical protein BB561_005937 [Smittium simulii]